jgi:hypothetical protein
VKSTSLTAPFIESGKLTTCNLIGFRPSSSLTDPDAEEKIHDVVGLYLNPPNNAVVLSVNEKTQIQALSRTQPLLPLRPGLPCSTNTRVRAQRCHQPVCRLGNGNWPSRRRMQCSEHHTAADCLRFLNTIARCFRRKELHIILDNSSRHTTPEVQAWLASHPRVHFHFTPKGASVLNLVEAWFEILTRKSVRRGSFDTVRALVRHIRHNIEDRNSHPTPSFGQGSFGHHQEGRSKSLT